MRVLITGGAGFIGCNAADRFLADGHDVTVLDNLSRPGSTANLDWLSRRHPTRRGPRGRPRCRCRPGPHPPWRPPDAVIHLAAQVAVTTSVQDPRSDFEINALGTLKRFGSGAPGGTDAVVLYASTNKVYGGLEDLRVVALTVATPSPSTRTASPNSGRWTSTRRTAVPRVRRTSTPATTRASTTCGPSCCGNRASMDARQFGMEDQGWVAWFVLAAMSGKPITIYGDGCQVRDVLFVDDLVAAYRAAIETPAAWGEIINVGGGGQPDVGLDRFRTDPRRTARPSDPGQLRDWRSGDQRIFVSDIRKAERLLNWKPTVAPKDGVRLLFEWAAAEAGA